MPKKIPEEVKVEWEHIKGLIKTQPKFDNNTGKNVINNQVEVFAYFSSLSTEKQKLIAYYFPHDLAIAFGYPKLQAKITEINIKNEVEFERKKKEQEKFEEDQAELTHIEEVFLTGIIKKIKAQVHTKELVEYINVNTDPRSFAADPTGFIDINRLSIILNSRDRTGTTALMHAMQIGNNNMVDYLLSLKINPNIQNKEGSTALHIAANNDYEYGFYALFKHIDTENPANNMRINIPNLHGVTAPYLGSDNRAINNYAITHEAMQHATNLMYLLRTGDMPKFHSTLLQLLCSDPKTFDLIDVFNAINVQYNRTLLMICAEYGHLEIVKFLIENLTQYNPEIALNAAFLAAAQGDQVAVLNYLLSMGANLETRDVAKNNALILAALSGSEDALIWLIDRGLDVDSKGERDFTPLQHAVNHNYEDICGLLYTKGADINAQNTYGHSPLRSAMLYGFHPLVYMFVAGKVKDYGYTDFMLSILNNNITGQNGAVSLFKAIIQKKDLATLNAVTEGGYSALMIAAQSISRMANTPNLKAALLQLILLMVEGDPLNNVPGANLTQNNKMHINFLFLLYANRNWIDNKFMLQLFDVTTSKKFKDSHHGQNIFHLCFASGANLINRFLDLNTRKSEIFAAINELDEDGNSPLSYLLFDTRGAFDSETILRLIEDEDYDAKYIRNGIELKSQLHLKMILWDHDALNIDYEDFQRLLTDKDRKDIQDNTVDEHGRTALHEAFIRNKPNFAALLITAGANTTVTDRVGRTAFHYAAIRNLLPQMLGIPNVLLEDTDMYGITPLLLAFQVAKDNADLLNLEGIFTASGKNDAPTNPINIFLLGIRNQSLQNNINWIKQSNFDYKIKLALFSAIRNYFIITSVDANSVKALVKKAALETIAQEFQDTQKYQTGDFPPGETNGAELELPGMVDVTILPTDQLVEWFGSTLIDDATVYASLLGPYASATTRVNLELVSPIIYSYTELEKFLAMCQIFEENGVTVNRSGALHIHTGANEAPNVNPPVPEFIAPNKLLTYAKYLALNYISIEQLLRGFMRDANAFDEFGEVYVRTISRYADDISAAGSIEALKHICSHSTSLDLTALDRLGTTEFRLHEGTIQRWIIFAWADCLRRLTLISREQALAHKAGTKFKTFEDIEQLVYILIAMRNYDESWDPILRAAYNSDSRTATAYPGFDNTPAQLQIREAPFYNMLRIIIYGTSNDDIKAKLEAYLSNTNDAVNTIFSKRGENKSAVLEQVIKTTEFLRTARGLQQNHIDHNTLRMLNDLKDQFRTTLTV